MDTKQLELMSSDKLWELLLKIREVLSAKLTAENEVIQKKLKLIEEMSTSPELPRTSSSRNPHLKKRTYPKPHAKFRNPKNPEQTWSGRGLRPRWISELVGANGDIERFRIPLKSDDIHR